MTERKLECGCRDVVPDVGRPYWVVCEKHMTSPPLSLAPGTVPDDYKPGMPNVNKTVTLMNPDYEHLWKPRKG